MAEKYKTENSGSFRLEAFGYAIRGILFAVKTQLNLKIHFTAAILIVIAGWYFRINTSEWLTIIIVIGLVIFAELLNTAVELIIDMVSPDYNKIAGKAKDVAAGAVLVSAVTAFIAGMIIFIPRLVN
jgi:diacylglycerol kinase